MRTLIVMLVIALIVVGALFLVIRAWISVFEQVPLDYPERLAALRWNWRRQWRDRLQRCLDQLPDGPDMIRDPKRHCWRLLQCLMRPAEIVERDVQAHGR